MSSLESWGQPNPTPRHWQPVATSLLAFLAMALVIAVLGRVPAREQPAATEASPRADPQVGSETSKWTVVSRFQAHHMLIIEVESRDSREAISIAQRLVEPVKSKYDEVLVYMYPPDSRGSMRVTRVQWTPRGGYQELSYERE